tara:strand:+ start:167 stop:532 length:366 start_codon:yes stop_codon:yes gene_type:complete
MGSEIELFNKGIDAFNNRNYYDAHEYWEEIWIDYKLQDARFIQGLIQLSVSYFHYFNANLKGAKSMLRKCLTKFEGYKVVRGIDVESLVLEILLLQLDYQDKENNSINKDIYTISLKVLDE